MPIETLGTEISAFFWNVFTLRDHTWHKRDLSGKLAAIRYSQNNNTKPPHGAIADNWGRATSGVFSTGPCAMLDIFTPVSQQAEWLQQQQPDYLLTHPSILLELVQHCQNNNVEIPSLKEVRTVSEALPDGLRELCRQTWNTRLIDMYSTIELGYLALQCPESEHYHVQAEGVLLEVLNDRDRPCAPGEIGRVVVTNLHNYASPLIRYEVGDYAEVGEPCMCGRGLPVLKRILGRYRNLITQPNGDKHWPQLGVMKLHEIAPVTQFQAIQHSLEAIEINLITPRPLQGEEKEALLQRFKETIGPSFSYTINEVNTLQRSASGKYEEFISKV
ncbi:MAG: phenylacetate--CoA ligase family protein [Pseudomonadota bacterium]